MVTSRIKIKISVEKLGECKGELVLFLAPRTVNAIVKALPLEGKVATGKGNIYFSIPVKVGVEKGKTNIKKGNLAYWPQANAFCIFYEDSTTYSPVNIIGKITENLEILKHVKNGNMVKVEKTA